MVFVALGCLAGCRGAESPPPGAAGVVLISVDTLRADHMGIYGYARDTTPYLDRFFENGTVFWNASSTAPCTIPAIRQFLYGAFDVEESREPLAERLRNGGFATAAFVSQQQLYKDGLALYARGFDTFELQARDEVDLHGMTARRADRVSDGALAWLEENGGRGPFFLWLHYFDPHDPYEPPEAYRHFDRGNSSSRSGDVRTHLRAGRSAHPGRQRVGGLIFDAEDEAHFNNLYDGEVRFVDAQIGRVLDALPDRGQSGIVFLIADHGEWLGEEQRWGHCATLGEEVIRVPFLVRVAGGPLSGSLDPRLPVSTVDALPTILGLAGIATPSGRYHGTDLRGLGADREVLAFWRQASMIRRGAWKQLFVEAAPTALYRIAADPREERNLIARERLVSEELSARMASHRELAAMVRSHDRRVVEQLRQIGYLD